MSKSITLRQRAISVLYLVSLCLFFIYSSIDFSDSVYLSYRRLEDRFHLAESVQWKAILRLQDICRKGDSCGYARRLPLTAEVERAYDSAIMCIDSIQYYLIRRNGLGRYPYLSNGKSTDQVRNLLIGQGYGAKLWRRLQAFYAIPGMAEVGAKTVFLPSADTVRTSKGKLIKGMQFYFGKMSVNMSLLHLISFKTALLEDRFAFYERIFGQPARESMSTAMVDSMIYALRARDSVLLAKAEGRMVSDSSTRLVSLNSRFLMRLPAEQDRKETRQVTVLHDGKEIVRRKVMDSIFLFQPSSPGNYRIEVRDGGGRALKSIAFYTPTPWLAAEAFGVLFIGVDNRLVLNNAQVEDGRGRFRYVLHGNGELYVTDSCVYARVFQKGFVTVDVLAAEGSDSGRLLLTRRYLVHETSRPAAWIDGLAEEATATPAQLRDRPGLSARSTEPFLQEAVYVSRFDVIYVPDPTKPVSVIFHNQGSGFSSDLRQVMARLRPGNVLYFSNIITKSSLGTESEAECFSLTIR